MCATVCMVNRHASYTAYSMCVVSEKRIHLLGAHDASNRMDIWRVGKRATVYALQQRQIWSKFSKRKWSRAEAAAVRSDKQCSLIHRDGGARIHTKPNHRHRYIRFTSLDVVIHDDNVIQHGVEICKFNVVSVAVVPWFRLGACVSVCVCDALQSVDTVQCSYNVGRQNCCTRLQLNIK